MTKKHLSCISLSLALLLPLCACAAAGGAPSPSASPSPPADTPPGGEKGEGRTIRMEIGDLVFGEVTAVVGNELTLKLIKSPDMPNFTVSGGGPGAAAVDPPEGSAPGGDAPEGAEPGDFFRFALPSGAEMPDIPENATPEERRDIIQKAMEDAGVTFERGEGNQGFGGRGGPGMGGGFSVLPEDFVVEYTGEDKTVYIPAGLQVTSVTGSSEVKKGDLVSVAFDKNDNEKILRVTIVK